MPIEIDNALPCLAFRFPVANFALWVLYDTGASLNTGLFDFHVLVMKLFPSIVHSFERVDGPKPFHPLKLIGAIEPDSSVQHAADHGDLIAIIRYILPSPNDPERTILMPFALGKHVAVNTIIGKKFIKQISLNYNAAESLFESVLLKAKFPEVPKKPYRGLLPPHQDFSAETFLASPEFTSMSAKFKQWDFRSEDVISDDGCLRRNVTYTTESLENGPATSPDL
jgi:hypothetical protein